MSYISTLSGFEGLGQLSKEYTKKIQKNKSYLESLIKQETTFKGLGYLPQEGKNGSSKLLAFDDVVNLYNKHISKEEIQAWVWYKRSMGVEMKGWNKYYLKGSSSTVSEVVITTRATMLLANNFKPLKNIEAGTMLGKYLKQHDGSQAGKWNIVRTDEGIVLVNAEHSKVQKTANTASIDELNRLVNAGALFFLEGELMPYPVYAYGNIYDRELTLRKDAVHILKTWGKSVFEKHEQVLKDRKPEMLTVTNPDPKMRPILTCICDFAKETSMFSINEVREEFMEMENVNQFRKVNGKVTAKKNKDKIKLDLGGQSRYSLSTVYSAWLFTLNVDTDFKSSSAIDIVDYYINGIPLRDDKLSAGEKAELKANARNEGEELFSRFLNEVLTFEDQQKLDYSWNREYNGYSDVAYQKVPIGFECSSIFKSGLLQFTDAQREGVAFQESQGSGINAFDVGVGKTMTAIANLANQLYQGKAKRALIVVPKPTYEKWLMEIAGDTKVNRETGEKEFIYGVLSGTGVKINKWFNLGTDTIKKINIKKKVDENSITVMTYEGFKKLGFGKGVSEELLTELINILGQSKEKTARDKEIDYQKFRKMIGVGLKNSIADIETLGFDYLIIDEAHRCKNVFESVKADEDKNKRYAMTSATSETGMKAFFLCNYMQRKYGRNIMLLTATPFTNSPLEIYSMLSLVAHESLIKQGLINMDAFFDMFVLPTTEWTANYKEQIVEKEVVKSFINRNILSRIIYNHILYKTGEEAGVKRPCKINLPLLYVKKNNKSEKLSNDNQVLTYLNMTDRQRQNQRNIVSMLQSATQTGGKPNTALMFQALNKSLDNAFSPFLIDGRPSSYKEFVDGSPKIKYTIECIESVKLWHEQNNDKCSGQIIYSNRGKAFFPLIKDYLINESGYKKGVLFDNTRVDEVEIVTSEISEPRKEIVKEAFLEGVVKIIIGTATIREGIDLQKNGSVIYNLYPEWNPTDILQLSGRIWRQGNKFGYVRIVMPLVQDSMDIFVFQKLEEKTSRINDIWFRGNRGNVLDVESLDPQEIKLALITDVNSLVYMFFEQEAKEIERNYKKGHSAIDLIGEISGDIRKYKYYRDENVSHLINNVYPRFKNSGWFQNDAKDRFTKEQLKRAADFLKDVEKYIESSERDDKTLFSLFRRMQDHNFGNAHYYLSEYKEYTSKVRKTERNILKPKGFDINSNLTDVETRCFSDMADTIRKSVQFTGELTYETITGILEMTDIELCGKYKAFSAEQCIKSENKEKSPRWISLFSEITTKKSALNVTGKNAVQRAEEFAKLNYLLKYRLSEMNSNSCGIPNIDNTKALPDNANRKILILKLKAKAKLKLLKLINIAA